MIVGSFGPKNFEVRSNRIYTFRELSISGELNAKTEDASRKKPATTVNGPGLLKVSLVLPLLSAAGVEVQAEIDAWTSIGETGAAYPFILCGKTVSKNNFLLKSYGASDYIFSQAGLAPYLAAANLKLEFEEYIPPGSSLAATSNASAKSAVGSGSSISASNPYKVPSTAQKAQTARTNPGMSR